MRTSMGKKAKLNEDKLLGLLSRTTEKQKPTEYWKPSGRDYSGLMKRLKAQRMDN